MGLRPAGSLLKVFNLALNERFTTWYIKSPVSDWQSDVIETTNENKPRVAYMNYKMYPAAAMAAKSASVIQVFQWASKTLEATEWSWYWQNVHSSMILGSPVTSKREGVIHGWRSISLNVIEQKTQKQSTAPLRQATRRDWHREPSESHRENRN